MFIDGFDAVGFVVNYIVVAVFVVLFVGWKIIKRTKMVPLMEVDLLTGRRDISQQQFESEPTKDIPWYIVVKRFVFS